MSNIKTKKSNFRQRGYKKNGTTELVIVYGDTQAPDPSTHTLVYDHQIEEVTVITDLLATKST